MIKTFKIREYKECWKYWAFGTFLSVVSYCNLYPYWNTDIEGIIMGIGILGSLFLFIIGLGTIFYGFNFIEEYEFEGKLKNKEKK